MRGPLDEDDPRRCRVDMPEVLGEGLPRDLGQGAGQLHAGRTADDDHERHPGPAPRLVRLALGDLEGHQDLLADRQGVLQALQARRSSAQSSWPKYAWVAPVATMRWSYRPRRRPARPASPHVDRGGLRQQDLTFLVTEDPADRGGDVGRAQRGGGHLVEERLEEMMIGAVEDRDPPGARRSARAAASPAKPAPMMTTRGCGGCCIGRLRESWAGNRLVPVSQGRRAHRERPGG